MFPLALLPTVVQSKDMRITSNGVKVPHQRCNIMGISPVQVWVNKVTYIEETCKYNVVSILL